MWLSHSAVSSELAIQSVDRNPCHWITPSCFVTKWRLSVKHVTLLKWRNISSINWLELINQGFHLLKFILIVVIVLPSCKRKIMFIFFKKDWLTRFSKDYFKTVLPEIRTIHWGRKGKEKNASGMHTIPIQLCRHKHSRCR